MHELEKTTGKAVFDPLQYLPSDRKFISHHSSMLHLRNQPEFQELNSQELQRTCI
ncbi:hypothetical protein ACLOJK_010636 [Asimina triloba]